MSECPPPQKGFKCLNCWACEQLPNSTRAQCIKNQLVGPARSITTCEAGRANLYSTKEKCETNCKESGAICYKCEIQPGEKEGRCLTIHPKNQLGKPLDTCPDWPGVFATQEECKNKCTQSGPVNPVAKCWQSTTGKCECVLGDAEGPHGPLDTCDSDLGFYKTRHECVEACEGTSGGDRTIWIIVGASVGVLLLLIIIGIIIYFVWKKHR